MRAVILPVNSVTLPITLAEKASTPRTIEAAKSDPGSLGRLMVVFEPPPEVETGVAGMERRKTGS